MNALFETVRCRECGNKFRYYNNPGGDLPDCPVCSVQHEEVDRLDLTSNKAPSIGGSPQAQAAKIVQEVAERDYGLTNFKSRTEIGEKSVPELTPMQQKMDDAWKGAGTFKSEQRFPGLQPGQGWLDAARAVTGAGYKPIETAVPILREMRRNPAKAAVINEHGRSSVRELRTKGT